MIKGEKVQLREVRRADIQYYVKWFNDPEVIQYLSMYLPMTEMAEEKWIEGLADNVTNKAHFLIEALDGDTPVPIGNLGISEIDPRYRNGNFGIAIGEKAYWSRGFGTEAAQLVLRYGFEQLNLYRINSSAFAFNERSLNLHRKVGFVEEARRREVVYKNGAYRDMVVFGLLREEWLANNT